MAEDVKEEILLLAENEKNINFEILAKTVILEHSIYRDTVRRLDSVPDEPSMNNFTNK